MIRNPQCDLCPLHETAKNICIAGRQVGEPSGVLLLGQSPGEVEDQQGRVFVGPTGKFLSDATTAVGLTDFFVTNPIRCMIPARTKVDQKWLTACKPYLYEELDEQKPTYILAMGNEALQALTGHRDITKHTGKTVWSERWGAWIYPIPHPSSVLYNRGTEESWKRELAQFARITRGEVHDTPPVDVELLDTVDKVAHFIKDLRASDRFTYDYECRASSPRWPHADQPLPWWHLDFKPYTLSFTVEEGRASVLPLLHPESPFSKELVLKLLQPINEVMASTKPKSPHNGTYDDLQHYRLTGVIPYLTFDTMPAIHTINEDLPKSLKRNLSTIFGWPDYDVDAKLEHPLSVLYPYNGYDTAGTWLLWGWCEERLAEDPRLEQYFYRLVVPMLRNIDKMIARGVYVDRHELAVQLKKNHRIMQAQARLLPVENPNSPQQIGKWLYEGEGLPIIKRTKTGQPSTDEETINRLAIRFPSARDVLYYRKPKKKEGTYLRPPRYSIRYSFDGRSHPEIRTTSPKTGRLASGHHTVPRPDYDDPNSINPRYIYTAPPGWTHIAADINQGESRLVAWAAAGYPTTLDGATGMLAAWADRTRDVYVETAAYNLGIEIVGQSYGTKAVSKKERQEMGKVPVLAMQYDISPKGLREYAWSEYELEWSEGDAARIYANFHSLWPEIKRWHAREGMLIRERGYVRSKIGRIRHLPNALTDNQYAVAEAIREGINAQIQSLLSDILQRAHTLVNGALDPERAFINANIHDALNGESEDDYVDEAVHIIRQAVRYAPISLKDLGLFVPPGLIDCEVTVGPWGKGVVIA